MRFLFGFLLIILGGLITIKSENMLAMFGRVGFAEQYLGTEGGSRLFYKLLGVAVILFAFMLITNLHIGILEWIAQTFFGAFLTP